MKNHPPTDPQTARLERHLSLTRRNFLRGIGVCLALPIFESSLAPVLRAATKASAASGGAMGVTSTGAPLRMAFVYFPNGAHQANWWPTGEGSAFELGKTMQPLAPLQGAIQVLGGLDH